MSWRGKKTPGEKPAQQRRGFVTEYFANFNRTSSQPLDDPNDSFGAPSAYKSANSPGGGVALNGGGTGMIHASGIHAIRSGVPLQVPRRKDRFRDRRSGVPCFSRVPSPSLALLGFSWPYHLAGVKALVRFLS